MRRLAVFALAALSTVALAADDFSVTFSDYHSTFRLVSFEAEHGVHRFRGRLKVTGTLVADFDSAPGGRAGGPINFLTFVPDARFLPRLSHGTELTVSKRITLTIRDYATDVECDARQYWVTVSAGDVVPLQAGLASGPDAGGC